MNAMSGLDMLNVSTKRLHQGLLTFFMSMNNYKEFADHLFVATGSSIKTIYTCTQFIFLLCAVNLLLYNFFISTMGMEEKSHAKNMAGMIARLQLVQCALEGWLYFKLSNCHQQHNKCSL
jgi:hypothetical protein